MYEIIYADPPWNYTAFSNKIPSRTKEGQPYNAMRMVDIYMTSNYQTHMKTPYYFYGRLLHYYLRQYIV